MDTDSFIKNLLSIYPYWQYNVIRPFMQYNKRVNGEISLDNYYLLRAIQAAGGLTMTEVAQHIATSKQQATLRVDRLCEEGYLERSFNKNDRRIVKVVVTKKAVKEIDNFYENTQGFFDELCENLNEEDIGQFNRAMEQLLEVLPKLV